MNPRAEELLASIAARWRDTYGLFPGEQMELSVATDQRGAWRLVVIFRQGRYFIKNSYQLPARGALEPSLQAFLEDMGNERT